MKLILQKDGDGSVYAYLETEKHHKVTRKQRGKPLDPNMLRDQCDLGMYFAPFHMVFDIKKPKKKKRK